MKVAQLLREDDADVFHVTKRSEINAAVAAMSIATSIDFCIENRQNERGAEEIYNDYVALRAIMRKHSKTKVYALGSGLLHVGFDSRKLLEQLKACLDEIAGRFDPENKNVDWPWAVTVEDESRQYP